MQEQKKSAQQGNHLSGSVKMKISYLSILIVVLLLIGGGYWIYQDSFGNAPHQIESTGNTGAQGYIGPEKAFSLACAAAGVNQSHVKDFSIDFDKEQGRMIYEVDFREDATDYSYDLDALDGTIISQEQEKERPDWAEQQAVLTHSEALDIALKQSGFDEAQVQVWKNHLKEEDGIPVYDIKIREGNNEYTYTVDAKQGIVIGNKQEQWKNDQAGGAGLQNDSGNNQAATADIGETQAKTLALQHASLSEDEVQRLKVKRSYDDGRNLYEVEFHAGRLEYDYKIDAASGDIVEFEKES